MVYSPSGIYTVSVWFKLSRLKNSITHFEADCYPSVSHTWKIIRFYFFFERNNDIIGTGTVFTKNGGKHGSSKNDITTEFHKYPLLFAIYDELDAFLEKKNACVLDNSPSNRMYMAAAFDLVYTSLKHEMHSGRISESDFWHLKKVLQEETII